MNLISLLTMHEYIVFLRFIIFNIFLYIFFNYNIILSNLAANVFLGNILFLVFYFIYCLFLETEFCREDLKVMKMKIENKALLLSFIALCSSCINYAILLFLNGDLHKYNHFLITNIIDGIICSCYNPRWRRFRWRLPLSIRLCHLRLSESLRNLCT